MNLYCEPKKCTLDLYAWNYINLYKSVVSKSLSVAVKWLFRCGHSSPASARSASWGWFPVPSSNGVAVTLSFIHIYIYRLQLPDLIVQLPNWMFKMFKKTHN